MSLKILFFSLCCIYLITLQIIRKVSLKISILIQWFIIHFRHKNIGLCYGLQIKSPKNPLKLIICYSNLLIDICDETFGWEIVLFEFWSKVLCFFSYIAWKHRIFDFE